MLVNLDARQVSCGGVLRGEAAAVTLTVAVLPDGLPAQAAPVSVRVDATPRRARVGPPVFVVRHEYPSLGSTPRADQALTLASSARALAIRSENTPRSRGREFRSYLSRIAISAANSLSLR